jgi:hypothetical protein
MTDNYFLKMKPRIPAFGKRGRQMVTVKATA